MLLLTTTGRHSGRAHTVPLLYVGPAHAPAVIASYGGRPHHPDWYTNLTASPACRVQIDDTRFPARARDAAGPERDRLWAAAVSAYPGYTTYQGRTDRLIPVVVLEPRD
jgi:deazaflavin-dependent oxidoreductase (nitroreductase family)